MQWCLVSFDSIGYGVQCGMCKAYSLHEEFVWITLFYAGPLHELPCTAATSPGTINTAARLRHAT